MNVRMIDPASRKDMKEFIRLPFDLYRDSPHWTPPLVSDIKQVMNRRKHPFYRHSDADFFLVERNGLAIARLAMLENRKYNDYQGERTAFFYYFDAANNADAVKALFEEAWAWTQQRELDRIVGPIGFLQGDSHGVLVEGFEHPPALGQAYNFPYYNRLLKQAGFVKKMDYFSGYLPGDYQLSERFFAIAERVKASRDFRIKSFRNKRELRQWISRIQEVYNRAFSNALGYRPLSEEEAVAVADRLLAISDPRLIKLVLKGDEIVGFLFAFVDVTAGIRRAKGKMWPWGWRHILREFKRSEWVNINGTGLAPGHRGVGANAVLYTEIANTIKAHGFKHADVVQISEKNAKSMGDMQAIGVQWYKKHRVYEKY